MESIIAGVVITLIGGLVTFGLHRLERHLERQDREAAQRDAAAAEREKKIDEALHQYRVDILAIARKLKMRRDEVGQLR